MSVDLVVGLTRRTSYSLIRFLLKQGCQVVVSDLQDTEEKRLILKELSAYGEIKNALGKQDGSLIEEFHPERVFPSPGVPMKIDLIQKSLSKNIPVIGDIELFYRTYPKIQYVGITGTDGKTTTVSLLQDMVSREYRSMAVGNIGTAVFEAEGQDLQTLILELSSFQLETIVDFHPQVAALLNVAEDHMDRYDSFEDYRNAKLRIFKNQTPSDVAILNQDDPSFEFCSSQTKAKIQTFSLKDPTADAFFDGKNLVLAGKPLLEREEMILSGIHNVANALAASLMALSLNVSRYSIVESLRTFKGLEHRMEWVRELNGVSYYNDSKATTVNAVEKALQSFDQPIILIAGGRDKDLDFSQLTPLVRQKVKKLILIGEAAHKIRKAWSGVETENAQTLDRAVKSAREQAQAGDVVLLSPGCASFDQFKSYTERGKVFKELVNSL